MIFSGSGLVFLGGLIGSTLCVSIILEKRKLSWPVFADIIAPLIMVGYSIGRIGCFLVGDDYGLPTNVPWGIAFPNGVPPSTYSIFENRYPWVDLTGFSPGVLKVHPTQIYEIVLGGGIFYYLYQRRLSIKIQGSLFFTYLILAGIERFAVEFLRINQKYFIGLSGAQIISKTSAVVLSFPSVCTASLTRRSAMSAGASFEVLRMSLCIPLFQRPSTKPSEQIRKASPVS